MNMKKMISVVLAALLLLSVAAAVAEPMVGGWSVAENNAVTEEQKAVFDEAIEKLMGVSYKPVAYLGSQLVAGTNHCFLCKATVIYPDAVPSYKLVYIYQDLQGDATVTQVADLDIASLSVPAVQE